MNYTEIPSAEVVSKTVAALKERNIEAIVVGTREEALAKIKELIPAGASVNNGSSRTLQEIGYVDLVKGDSHGWNNLHGKVVAEADPAKQKTLRNEALLADYYLGSVHGLSETGEMVIASASGSQLPPIVFTSKNVIFVVSTQKITPTLDSAIQRLREYVFPLEDARMKSVNMGGSTLAKMLIFEREPAFMGRSVRVILVNEKLGF